MRIKESRPPIQNPNDQESTKLSFQTIQRFQAGDEKAFIEIYETYKERIYFFILNMTAGKENLSEELTHEAFLRLYKNRESFNFSVQFTTWFWTIARNLTIDELRKKNPIDYTPQNKIDQSIDQIPVNSEEFEIESLLIKKAEKEILYQAIGQLKPRQKEAILLRIASDLTYEEIAEILNLKVNAVKALLLRARKNIEGVIKNKSPIKVAT
jgi:RNA polymerase sigma-70 factor (ECF subfamily)